MSTYYVLVVPEEEQTRAVIDAYYDYVAEKEAELDSDLSRLPRAREHALETFEERERVIISESPPYPGGYVGDGWRDRRDIFESTPDGAYIVRTESQVQDLLAAFRKKKRQLLAEAPIVLEREGLTYTAEEIEHITEAQTIALCEFALSHAYAVRLE